MVRAVRQRKDETLFLQEAQRRWDFERALAQPYTEFAGVDEAGRGCLAGPVVAAAVVLGHSFEMWQGIDDSKALSKTMRAHKYAFILQHAAQVGVGLASSQEIDEMNILQASRLAMGRALLNLSERVPFALVDGIYSAAPLHHPISCLPVIDGDARCLSIAAASIVAKVERDRLMTTYANEYPNFGFDQHVGYGTKFHLRALQELGPTPIHRYSYAPVRAVLQMRDLP